jgi:hypothetical protein
VTVYASLRRWNAGIVRRLGRQPQLRLELGDPRRQPRVRRHQRLDPGSSVAIRASLSAKSGGGVIHKLIHIRASAAMKKFAP